MSIDSSLLNGPIESLMVPANSALPVLENVYFGTTKSSSRTSSVTMTSTFVEISPSLSTIKEPDQHQLAREEVYEFSVFDPVFKLNHHHHHYR